jgi:hypothetical protein
METSRKVSTFWCGKVMIGGAGVTIGRTFRLDFSLLDKVQQANVI